MFVYCAEEADWVNSYYFDRFGNTNKKDLIKGNSMNKMKDLKIFEIRFLCLKLIDLKKNHSQSSKSFEFFK